MDGQTPLVCRGKRRAEHGRAGGPALKEPSAELSRLGIRVWGGGPFLSLSFFLGQLHL